MIHYCLRFLSVREWRFMANQGNPSIRCENEAIPVVHEAINEWIEDKLKII